MMLVVCMPAAATWAPLKETQAYSGSCWHQAELAVHADTLLDAARTRDDMNVHMSGRCCLLLVGLRQPHLRGIRDQGQEQLGRVQRVYSSLSTYGILAVLTLCMPL